MIERKAGKAMAGKRAMVTVTGITGSNPTDKELVELVLKDTGIFRGTKLKGKKPVLEAEQQTSVQCLWITLQGSSPAQSLCFPEILSCPSCASSPATELLPHTMNSSSSATCSSFPLRAQENPQCSPRLCQLLPLREFSENISIPAGRVGSWDSRREHKETAS